jgi:outer membrane protein assembly factor BamB
MIRKLPHRLLPAALLLLGSLPLHAEDWPTHRHDISRSGITSDTVELPLSALWTRESKYPPQPAWPGPARRDGWHKTENLKPRVIFDWAYHVIAAQGGVFFGSSTDDKVYCLDALTGEEKWTFFTDGPVRLAPTVWQSKVYVGSDDGNVYCLEAESGELIWKYEGSVEDRRVPGNNRIMSVWPVRSGILVDRGTAYFTAGLFTFEGAYVCAVDALTGAEQWKKLIPHLTPQGYLVASADRLYIPTGRGEPFVIERETGEYLYTVEGAGGTFCLLSDDLLIYGPGKQGLFEAFKPGDKDEIATFEGNTMIVTAAMSFLHTDTQLSALDRARYLTLAEQRTLLSREMKEAENTVKKLDKEKDQEEIAKLQSRIDEIAKLIPPLSEEMKQCIAWKTDCKYPYSLCISGNGLLFAGGRNEVAGIDTVTGKVAWTAPVKGRALDLALADGKLIVSTDEGSIHCFGKAK